MEISWQGIRLGTDRERGAAVKREQDVNQCGKHDKKQSGSHSSSFFAHGQSAAGCHRAADAHSSASVLHSISCPQLLQGCHDCTTGVVQHTLSSSKPLWPDHLQQKSSLQLSVSAVGFVGWAARGKSLSGKLDQALSLQSLLSLDKQGWGALSNVFSFFLSVCLGTELGKCSYLTLDTS